MARSVGRLVQLAVNSFVPPDALRLIGAAGVIVLGLRLGGRGGEQAERAEQQREGGGKGEAGAGAPKTQVQAVGSLRISSGSDFSPRPGAGHTFTPLGRWAAGPLGRWAAGPLGRWAAGPLGRWAAGPLGRWAAGPLGRWA